MVDERQETLEFLTRMAGIVKEATEIDMGGKIPVELKDVARLVKMGCLAEKEKDERQQRYFERLCETPGVSFYEA